MKDERQIIRNIQNESRELSTEVQRLRAQLREIPDTVMEPIREFPRRMKEKLSPGALVRDYPLASAALALGLGAVMGSSGEVFNAGWVGKIKERVQPDLHRSGKIIANVFTTWAIATLTNALKQKLPTDFRGEGAVTTSSYEVNGHATNLPH